MHDAIERAKFTDAEFAEFQRTLKAEDRLLSDVEQLESKLAPGGCETVVPL